MYVSAPQLSTDSQIYYISGEVVIDPSVAIAPGSIIQADPDSRIVIAAGTCIGMGSVIHAYQGVLEIGPGVSLGAGVLILGQGKIGANTCIGATTTIINPQISNQSAIPPGILMGDTSRQVEITQSEKVITQRFIKKQSLPQPEIRAELPPVPLPQPPEPLPQPSRAELPPEPLPQPEITSGIQQENLSDDLGDPWGELNTFTPPPAPPPTIPAISSETIEKHTTVERHTTVVYGKEQINQLLSTLFPHRRL